MSDKRIETVGQLRKIMADLSDETQVQIHEGWDWPIGEYDIVQTEGLILFAATPDNMELVDLGYVCKRFGGNAECPAPQPREEGA